MSLRALTFFLAASWVAVEAVPSPDQGEAIESRDEFRERTRKVFVKAEKSKKHESFKDSGFTDDEAPTTRMSVYFDAVDNRYYLKEGVSANVDDSLAKAVFVDGVCT